MQKVLNFFFHRWRESSICCLHTLWTNSWNYLLMRRNLTRLSRLGVCYSQISLGVAHTVVHLLLLIMYFSGDAWRCEILVRFRNFCCLFSSFFKDFYFIFRSWYMQWAYFLLRLFALVFCLYFCIFWIFDIFLGKPCLVLFRQLCIFV